MKKTSLLFFTACLLLLVSTTHAQWGADLKYISKLQQQLKVVKGDTSTISLLNNLAAALHKVGENESCRKYAGMALQLINEKINTREVKDNPVSLKQYQLFRARAVENMGNGLLFENASMAFDTLQSALQLWQQAGDEYGIASANASLAEYFNTKGDHVSSLKFYQTSLAGYQKLKDTFNTGLVTYNIGLIQRYMGNYGDALESHVKTLQIGKQINNNELITQALLGNGFDYMLVKNYPEALKNQQEALEIFTAIKDSIGIGNVYYDIGVTYLWSGKLEEALVNHMKGLEIRKQLTNYGDIANSNNFISDIYLKQGKYPEALSSSLESVKYAELYGESGYIIGSYFSVGEISLKMANYETANEYYNKALLLSRKIKNLRYQALSLKGIAEINLLQNKTNKGITLLNEAATLAPPKDYKTRHAIYKDLAAAYVTINDYKNAYTNEVLYKQMSDSLTASEKIEKITSITKQLEFANRQALQKANTDKIISVNRSELRRQKLVKNISIAGLLIGVIFSLIFYLRFKEKKKLNEALEKTLTNLRSAQAQLVQSEKMASLGELTAGISHEIQNPLNFVTNFSEVNRDLILEMKEELAKGNIKEAAEIATDIGENEEKIIFHGKRADSIVKGMLQHSRSNTGQIELTDINALADEFLRLSYHGLRAKDKSFNAKFEMDFDETIGKIKVVPQDIGRVILNLINNAFYAVDKKKKNQTSLLQEGVAYDPTVIVQTKNKGNKIEVTVKDNGNGIPKEVMDKIFQPFFTTKPSGEGTGLGLSLSYDIIKAHGGELKVTTREGEGLPAEASAQAGTTFTILLPI
jgi:two-component system, NtrC family, sensor kinase